MEKVRSFIDGARETIAAAPKTVALAATLAAGFATQAQAVGLETAKVDPASVTKIGQVTGLGKQKVVYNADHTAVDEYTTPNGATDTELFAPPAAKGKWECKVKPGSGFTEGNDEKQYTYNLSRIGNDGRSTLHVVAPNREEGDYPIIVNCDPVAPTRGAHKELQVVIKPRKAGSVSATTGTGTIEEAPSIDQTEGPVSFTNMNAGVDLWAIGEPLEGKAKFDGGIGIDAYAHKHVTPNVQFGPRLFAAYYPDGVKRVEERGGGNLEIHRTMIGAALEAGFYNEGFDFNLGYGYAYTPGQPTNHVTDVSEIDGPVAVVSTGYSFAAPEEFGLKLGAFAVLNKQDGLTAGGLTIGGAIDKQ